MRIGVAALGRLSEDTGGKNYIHQFFREITELYRESARGSGRHEFVLFVSEHEKRVLGFEAADWLEIIEIPKSKRTPLHKVFAEQFRLSGYIKRSKIDVMYYPGNFTSLLSTTPSVVNIRATAHFYGTRYGISGMRRVIRSLLMPAGARHAKRIIAPSEDIKSDVVRFAKVDAGKITVIPHGVDLALFDGEVNRNNPEGLKLVESFGLSPKSYLLYVSALWQYKNQDKLIRAHAELVKTRFPDLKLVMAGLGTGTDGAYLKMLYSLPKELGTESGVIFTGALPQSSLRYLYAHARMFVFPSAYESFGNPIFESWASGIPVATSNVHSFPEIVADAGVLFDPDDQPSMVRAIDNLLSDEALRARLIKKGRARAAEFTWERCVRRTLTLLESVRPPKQKP